MPPGSRATAAVPSRYHPYRGSPEPDRGDRRARETPGPGHVGMRRPAVGRSPVRVRAGDARRDHRAGTARIGDAREMRVGHAAVFRPPSAAPPCEVRAGDAREGY